MKKIIYFRTVKRIQNQHYFLKKKNKYIVFLLKKSILCDMQSKPLPLELKSTRYFWTVLFTCFSLQINRAYSVNFCDRQNFLFVNSNNSNYSVPWYLPPWILKHQRRHFFSMSLADWWQWTQSWLLRHPLANTHRFSLNMIRCILNVKSNCDWGLA